MSTTDKTLLLRRIDKALDNIRPHLKVDGGDVEVLDIDEETMTLQIKWLGNCSSCSMSTMTMRGGIQAILRSEVPEVQDVVAV